MTFIKSLFLAIFATLILTYVFGVSLLGVFDMNFSINQHHVESIQAISLAALLVVSFIIVASVIALSVFGSIIFVGLLLFGTLLCLAVGIAWPVLFLGIVLWLCCRNKPEVQS